MGKLGNWFSKAKGWISDKANKAYNWGRDTAIPAIKKYGGKIINVVDGFASGGIRGLVKPVLEFFDSGKEKADEFIDVLPDSDTKRKMKEMSEDIDKKRKRAEEITEDAQRKAEQFKPAIDKVKGYLN